MRWTVQTQLVGPIVVLVLGLILAGAWFSLQTAEHAATTQLESQMRDTARSIQEASYPLTLPILEQIKQFSGFDFVLLRDGSAKGTLSSESIPSDLGRRTASGDTGALRLDRSISVDGIGYRYDAFRLERPSSPGDVLVVLRADTGLRASYRDALRTTTITSLVGGILAIVAVTAVAHRISRRVQTLSARTSDIVGGDYQPLERGPVDDEITDLTNSINDMAARLARYEETIKRTERLRLLEQVGGGLAHQMRNGLAGARLAIQSHLREVDADAEREGLDVALRELRMLDERLHHFLSQGEGDRGRAAQCDLSEVIEETAALFRPRCRHQGIELTCVTSPSCTVEGHAQEWLQVAINLVDNAIHAVGTSGQVAIELTAPVRDDGETTGKNDHVVLIVRDTGPGLPEEILETVYDPFVTGRKDGIGLGLAVTKTVVQRRGGSITWTREDGMTRFEVTIPKQHERERAGSSKL
ncbi:Sensor protein FixL [Planctomycetes bacterium Pan216]|uniref:histidine kinase n=1 Tax=Kolteria novifilia TaxID=2527975 RepID=A0A518BAE1_9BACT|nr:Sensor protein FixL [Planctomycetes bacterium Pan216]